MLILGLQGSPRKKGNTDTFLATFMAKAAQAGANVKTIHAARAGIVPCKGCGYCEKHGTCVIADDAMSKDIYGLIRRADLVVAASPVYFYGISAQLKILIDRCQTLWSRKYVYQLKDPLAATRKGLLFSVAASRGRQLFEGTHLTAKYFFDAIDAQMVESLTYRGIEAKGVIGQEEGVAADIDAAIERIVRPMLKRKRILFTSPLGACRAPMAAAIAQQRYGDRIRTDFGGWSPAPELQEAMVQSMHRIGVDMGYQRPQLVTQAFGGSPPDLFVNIGADVKKNMDGAEKTMHWSLKDPIPANDETMDRMRKKIDRHLDRLHGLIETI